MKKNLDIQLTSKPISTIPFKRKPLGFSNRTHHYLLHSSLPSGKWWWCFENKETRNKQDTRWYTQQVLYTNQWLEYNSMLVYTVVLSAVNLLLLLIPDHLVGKEAFLLGEIMMSFCGGRRQIIRLETTNSTLLNGLLFV